jgi:hypothetical protein
MAITHKDSKSWARWVGILGLWASTTTWAATPAVARAEITAGDSQIELLEQQLARGVLQRTYRTATGTTLYRSVTRAGPGRLEVQVLEGHASQRGSYRLEAGRLEVRDSEGQPLWAENLTQPLCLPELSGEFVRAHWNRLAPGSEPLRCVAPIIKARKVAPLQWRRLPDGPRGERIVELGPGSLGMRLFMIPTRMTFSADGTLLLAQKGQFEAPPRIDGRASYLRGAAVFTQARPTEAWPSGAFGPASAAP